MLRRTPPQSPATSIASDSEIPHVKNPTVSLTSSTPNLNSKDTNVTTRNNKRKRSDTFHGRSAFSEPETAIIRDIIAEHGSRMALYLDIHSFGSMVLYGYGNGVLPANALQLHLIGVQMAQAIDRVKWPTNSDYIVGNIFHVLYAASGGASDYAMQAAAPFSYTFELPAYRNSVWFDGFLVDPDFIEQAGFETWEGIKVGARAAAATAQSWKNLNTV